MKTPSRHLSANRTSPPGRAGDEITHELYARNAELAIRNKTLSTLRRLDEVTMASLETERLTGNITRILIEELSLQVAAIAIVEGKSRLRWHSVDCSHEDAKFCHLSPSTKPIPLTRRANVCVRAVRSRKPVTVRSLEQVFSPSFPKDVVQAHQEANGIKTAVCFPMATGAGVLGALVIGLNRPGRDLSRFERETLDGVVGLITIAIQKAQIYASLRETTKKLAVANKKLKELDALKTEFLSIASHQLRTPLAVAKGYLSMLANGMVGKVTQKQKRTILLLESNNEGLIALVNQLLNISRIESNRLKINLSSVDLGKVAGETLAFFAPRAQDKGLSLRLISPPGGKPVFVTADREKLREILTNLLDNAIKYTEKGGITMRFASKDALAVVEVVDTGYGLTDMDKRHLFEKFASGSASKHANVTSGFGLFVVKKVSEAMGGSVSAQSAGTGKGSTFRVALPLAKEGV